MKRLLALPVLVVLAAACGDNPQITQPESGGPATPSFAAGGNSGCYTVKFTSHSVGTFPVFAGTQTGDIGGTHVVVFAGASTPAPTGATWNFIGTMDWSVVGGPLDGLQFTTSLESRNVFNDPDLFAKISNLKTRATSGVQKANLTGRGETASDASTVDVWWNGVICP